MLVLLVELFVIPVVLARNAGFGERFWQDLGLVSLYSQWIALASALALCGFRKRLGKLQSSWVGFYSFAIILMITLCVAFAVIWSGLLGQNLGVQLLSVEANFLFRSLMISAIVSAVMLRYFYIQYEWKRNVQSESRARIQALQARIRPHFLFNSMNSIASLTRIDPALAERAVENLSALFRASLQSSDVSVSLQQELDLVRRYLDVETLRLGDRLRVVWSVDALPMHAMIPQLLIQPLVENAVYHGIESLASGGVVRISGELRDGNIRLLIENDFDVAAQRDKKSSNHIALDNVRERLHMLFPGKSGLTINALDHLFQVQLWLPVKEG